MYQGVMLDTETFGPGDLDLGQINRLPIQWRQYDNSRPEQVAERIADAHFVVTNKVVVDAAAMDSAPQLQLVVVAATGVNVVDLDTARQRGLAVCNSVGYGTDSLVQHVFALLLGLCNRVQDYHRDCMAGRWQQSAIFCRLDYPARELAGKTLGIVGYGELGRAVANIARAFGMVVRAASLPGHRHRSDAVERVPLAELLPRLDVLSLHCPLTEQTRHLIGSAELAAMKPSALLLNVARGGIVDETALATALRRGDIAGAGVDVLSREPPREGNPLLAPDIPNLLLTPHTAWGSQRSRQTLLNQVAENIQAFLDGRPKRLVV